MALRRMLAGLSDGVMCAMMNAIQTRHARDASTAACIESYLAVCSGLNRDAYFSFPAAGAQRIPGGLEWPSPVPGPHAPNNLARAMVLPGPAGPRGPTVVLLHALMSASDIGYRRIAAWFHARGWNAVFPHLPFHYSRIPSGHLNGELAITSHLVRNAETLRQAVTECRQLIALLREQGCRRFGVLGTSYGGWVGALLASVEEPLDFVALVQPVPDTEAAVWDNPAARTLRAQVAGRGVSREHVRQHAPWSCPCAVPPRCGGERTVLVAGDYDSIAKPAHVEALGAAWGAPGVTRVRQGHFGYTAMREALRALERSGLL